MFKLVHDQQFPKHLQLQQKWTNVRLFRNKNNKFLIDVAKNSVTSAKQCAQSFNDLPKIILPYVALSSYKVKAGLSRSRRTLPNQTFPRSCSKKC